MKYVSHMEKEVLFWSFLTNSNYNYFPGSEISPGITQHTKHNCNKKPNRKRFKQLIEKIKGIIKTIFSAQALRKY